MCLRIICFSREKLENIIRMHLKFNLSSFGSIAVFEQKNLSLSLRKSYIMLRDEEGNFMRYYVEDFVLTNKEI